MRRTRHAQGRRHAREDTGDRRRRPCSPGGFGATSIEELIAAAGLTKSGFFYHFKDKNELALGLLARHAEQTNRLFGATFGRGAQLSDDPLQGFLIGLRLLAERMEDLPGGHPGCVVGAMSYQDRLFDQEVRAAVAWSTTEFIDYFHSALERIVAVHPPREPVDLRQLALTICCMIDGGIVVDKSLGGGAGVLPGQLRLLCTHVRLIFEAPRRAETGPPPRAEAVAA